MEAVVLFLLVPLVYIALGTFGAIALRWSNKSAGIDLLLDVVFWPILLFYWITDA